MVVARGLLAGGVAELGGLCAGGEDGLAGVGERGAAVLVGFANSGGLVFVDESAEEVAPVEANRRLGWCWVATVGRQ